MDRVCYYIMETETRDGQYIPCIVTENKAGFQHTDWLWGKDLELARKCAADKNEALGLTPEDVDKIITSSFRASNKRRPLPEHLASYIEQECGMDSVLPDDTTILVQWIKDGIQDWNDQAD